MWGVKNIILTGFSQEGKGGHDEGGGGELEHVGLTVIIEAVTRT